MMPLGPSTSKAYDRTSTVQGYATSIHSGEVRRLIQDNELFNALLGLAVFVFLVARRHALRRLPKPSLLLAAYVCLLVAWIATIVESFVWPYAFNVTEHASYAISGVLLAFWSYLGLRYMGREQS
jgi:uncharacterized membrane protein YoaK (UPF0700 family)